MQKSVTLTSVGVLSAGKVFAAADGIIGLIFSLYVAIILPITHGEGYQHILFGLRLGGVSAIICMPVIYAAIGFFSGLLTSILYNLAAGLTGGVVLNLDE